MAKEYNVTYGNTGKVQYERTYKCGKKNQKRTDNKSRNSTAKKKNNSGESKQEQAWYSKEERLEYFKSRVNDLTLREGQREYARAYVAAGGSPTNFVSSYEKKYVNSKPSTNVTANIAEQGNKSNMQPRYTASQKRAYYSAQGYKLARNNRYINFASEENKKSFENGYRSIKVESLSEKRYPKIQPKRTPVTRPYHGKINKGDK